MINKKNLLGKTPSELGEKDAIHVAIVSVRAAKLILPGQKCSLNENREAVACSSKGVGVADPFRKENILRGQTFWLLLNQDSVPNVQHVWEHPEVDFTPPTKAPSKNSGIDSFAKIFGCDYNRLIEVCSELVEKESGRVLIENGDLKVVKEFPEGVDEDEFDDIDSYELWSEIGEEIGHEFYNQGTECCPEYEYPRVRFAKKKTE